MTSESPFAPPRRHQTLRRVLTAAAAIAVAVLVWRFGGGPSRPAPAGHDMTAMAAGPSSDSRRPVTLGSAEQRLIGITFAAVELAPLVRRIRTVGIVRYDETRITTVTTRVEGFVERLRADFTGQRVERGQTLLELYAPVVVATAEELLLGRRLLAELADGAPDARRSAEELVAAARRRLGYWDVPPDVVARAESAGTAPRTVPLRARAGGFAIAKAVTEGQRVMPGDALYQIADLTTVWIEGEVYERDLGSLRLGDSAEARFTALPGAVRRGRVSYLYPEVDADTRTARVRVALANADHVLLPGMYATLEIAGPPRPALSIPRSAALLTGQRTLVFMKRADGRFEPREVMLGAVDDERYEVLAGLAPGDTVVASGTFLLDAESNLGTLLGGMGGMPGMDLAPPGSRAEPARPDTHRHR